jgi:hypothetical protein
MLLKLSQWKDDYTQDVVIETNNIVGLHYKCKTAIVRMQGFDAYYELTESSFKELPKYLDIKEPGKTVKNIFKTFLNKIKNLFLYVYEKTMVRISKRGE